MKTHRSRTRREFLRASGAAALAALAAGEPRPVRGAEPRLYAPPPDPST